MPPTRRTSLGNRGELLARQLLEATGYTILCANYRCRWGEVDLVAKESDTLVFVEVRTKRGRAFGEPEESLTKRKAQKLVLTAQTFLEERGLEQSSWRIDLIAVPMDSQGRLSPLRHLQNVVEQTDF
jgi:putative endonuclease